MLNSILWVLWEFFWTVIAIHKCIPKKFSFASLCSSIKEPDQYDYYADEKPVLYKGIADLYTVSNH